MLSDQRKAHLIDVLARDGRVVAKEQAALLGISEDSIRRDLRELADAGRVRRVYGGALPPEVERPFAARVATAEKDAVAEASLALLEPGTTILLDGGTTSIALAHRIPSGARLTIATTSPHVAIAAAEHSDARVIVLGGELGRHSMVAGGALALEAIARTGADRFLLGASGVDADGVTTDDPDDAAVKRALAGASRETYLLASAEKLGARARHPVLPLDALAGVVVSPSDRDAARSLLGATPVI